jgi:hypothetical protein
MRYRCILRALKSSVWKRGRDATSFYSRVCEADLESMDIELQKIYMIYFACFMACSDDK